MALNWTWHWGFWSKGPDIEANRIVDANLFLSGKGNDFRIYDPKINRNVNWRNSSRNGILQYWQEKMTYWDKEDMQTKRRNSLAVPSSATEVVNI